MTSDGRTYYLNVALGILSALVVGMLIGGGEIGMTKGSFLVGLLVPVAMGLVASFWWARARLKSRDWIILVPLTYLLHCATVIPMMPADVRISRGIIYLIMIPAFIPLIALGGMLGNRVFKGRGPRDDDTGSSGDIADR